ncbi:MAG: helix-turn-helix domain-containing protein [Gemmobacter sp.]|nr:helix-turn-helix domain-containing protein [Gemmobacter sp.]
MTDLLPRPPAHVEPYVRILGPEGAVAFLLAFGGGQLYLPLNLPPPASLIDVVGHDAARALCVASPTLPRRVPTAKPWLAHVMHGRGLSVTEMARMLHVSDVAVRGWLKRPAVPGARSQDPRQLPLL